MINNLESYSRAQLIAAVNIGIEECQKLQAENAKLLELAEECCLAKTKVEALEFLEAFIERSKDKR